MNFYPEQFFPRRSLYLLLFFIFLWVFLFIPRWSHGQYIAQDTTEYRFWYSGFNARSTAMADANVADPGDLNGMYNNPAALVYSSKEPSLINNSLYNSSRSILLENITASLSHSKNHRFVGGITLQGASTQRDPVANSERVQFSQMDMTLGYSWLLLPTLSAGMKLNSMYGKTANTNIWTFNGSLGLLYSPSSLVSYGLVYRGTGLREDWLGSNPVFKKTESGETVAYSVYAPHRLELGVTLRFPSLVRYPDFVLSLSNEKIFGMDGLVYRGGLEVNLQNFMALRGGYFLSPFAEGVRLGVGFLFDEVRLDYAFAPTSIDRNGGTHQLSISLNI